MVNFVNAKINIGLHITSRRPDGYHELETLFYPVGRHNGTPANPEPLCDCLEIVPTTENSFCINGDNVDCDHDKNLVKLAADAFFKELDSCSNPNCNKTVKILLEKHLPQGAGLGGGSADASFTLTMLNELFDYPFSETKLLELALKLGADCPFFIKNTPSLAYGIGEKLTDYPALLKDWWCVLAKPDLHISTKEAFAGITPDNRRESLKNLLDAPIEKWRNLITNDFEISLFPKYPILAELKEDLYRLGATYASMSGSGSTIYGIYPTREEARNAWEKIARLHKLQFSTISKL